MSVHYSLDQLFEAIATNDVVALENAIFFLGARIHIVKLCQDLTPIEHAARLGNFEQVKILLEDLKRYKEEDSRMILSYMASIAEHAIPNRHKDMDFLLGILETLALSNTGYVDMNLMFQEQAFDFVEAIVEKNSETYIPLIVEICATNPTGKIEIRQLSDNIRTHSLFAAAMNEFRETDALYCAVVNDDTEEVKRLLPEYFRDPQRFPLSNFVDTFHLLSFRTTHCFPPSIKVQRIISLVVNKNYLGLLNILIDDNLAEIIKLTGQTKEEIFFYIFILALCDSRIHIIHHVISKLSQKHIQGTNWRSEYFGLKLDGKIECAQAIKGLCELGIVDKIEVVRDICAHLKDPGKQVPLHIATVTEVSLLDTLEEIEDFIRSIPVHVDLLNDFFNVLRELPLKTGRTDLVKPFAKYSIKYSQTDVMIQIGRSHNDLDCFDRFNEPISKQPAFPFDVHDSINRDDVDAIFLGGNKLPVVLFTLPNSASMSTNTWKLLKQGVEHSGRGIDTCLPTSKMRIRDRLQYNALKREQIASLTLQKLCRLTIREAVYTANADKPTDAMLSLYVKGYVPKLLVNYLLYRDENIHRPLYYALVNFSAEDSDSDDEDGTDDDENSDDDDDDGLDPGSFMW